MSKKNDRAVCFLKGMWNKLNALEDSPDREVKAWMQGYMDCLENVISILEEMK